MVSFRAKTREHRAVKRRAFISLLSGAAAAWPHRRACQQQTEPLRVGFHQSAAPEGVPLHECTRALAADYSESRRAVRALPRSVYPRAVGTVACRYCSSCGRRTSVRCGLRDRCSLKRREFYGVAARGASAAANDAGNWVTQHPITEQHGGERHERIPTGFERSRVRGGPER